jgi:hypothetical protein
MNDDFESLFNIILEEDGEATYNNNVQDINKKYKITLSTTLPSNHILKRANAAYDKFKADLWRMVQNQEGRFPQLEYLAAGLPLYDGWNYVQHPIEPLPSRSRQAIILLQNTPHLWLEAIKSSIVTRSSLQDTVDRMLVGRLLSYLDWYINVGKSHYERLALAAQKVEESKSRKGVEVIYADNCRYIQSPLSGSRYLIVGINPVSRQTASQRLQMGLIRKKSTSALKRHWTFKLRDFYAPPRTIKTNRYNSYYIAKKYEHIFTIKAENVANIAKQFE